MSRRVVAVYRKPSYSPLQHRRNDTAILDETLACLAAAGRTITRIHESDVEQGHIPSGDTVLNMCQGALASEQLMPLEEEGARVINRPSSVLGCHRHRLVRCLGDTPLAFPRTIIVPTAGEPPAPAVLAGMFGAGGALWMKRGDVHAERPEDVVLTDAARLGRHLALFAERGIAWAALQEHVPGPVVKFYAVSDGRFFRWYPADTGPGTRCPLDEDRLKALAFGAAARLRLEVFGGDAAVPDPDRPVLIDLNDWPSFAPFRTEAARSIADYVLREVEALRVP